MGTVRIHSPTLIATRTLALSRAAGGRVSVLSKITLSIYTLHSIFISYLFLVRVGWWASKRALPRRLRGRQAQEEVRSNSEVDGCSPFCIRARPLSAAAPSIRWFGAPSPEPYKNSSFTNVVSGSVGSGCVCRPRFRWQPPRKLRDKS
jgi:hypothetical protein